jgi:CubicO group peptidase (beta-lactamase class C family)
VAISRSERLAAEAARLIAAISYRDPSGKLELVVTSAGTTMPGGKPVDDDTPFDLASLTKPIFAAATLRLVARGALTLEAKPEQYVADSRGTHGGGVTLEQLLTHRSGLAAWGGLYLDVPHDPGTTAARRWIFGEATAPRDAPCTATSATSSPAKW